MKVYTIFFIAVFCSLTFAQEQNIELGRSNFKAKKIAVITETMQFTEDEADIFWPIYREYEYELSQIGDQEISLLKKYNENFKNLTDEKTTELMQQSFSIDSQLLDLRETYFNKIAEALNPQLAARYIQIESIIQKFVLLALAAQIPLVGDVLEDMKDDS
jgi:hypothetical protein